MASQRESLPREAERLKGRVRQLINNDLKEICRAEHLAVSGVKAVLQGRVVALIETAVQTNDYRRFETLRYRVQNRGNSPPPDTILNPKPPPQPSMSSLHSRPGQPSTLAGRHSGYNTQINFRKSPFYDILEPVTHAMELPILPQNRQTIEEYLTLSTQMADRLLSDSSLRLMLYCASEPMLGPYSPTDIAFPHQIDIRVNSNEIKANTRGLKNRPGSTRPVDITNAARIQPHYRNTIAIMYALTQKASIPLTQRDKKFYFVVNLVRKYSVEQLLAQIKRGSVISKEGVLAEMARKVNDDDIVATSTVMSLKCPISYTRIQCPSRSTVCSHNQCFDATAFLQLQEQAPTWTCPVCNKVVAFEGLAVDKYVEEILASTKASTEQVTIEPNGKWYPTTEGSAPTKSSRPSNNGFPESDSDDLVEISDFRGSGVPSQTNGTAHRQTPPVPSREVSSVPRSASAKRPAAEVIDLTLSSDEEDERPAKRPAYTPQHHPSDPHRSPSHRAASASIPPPTNGTNHMGPIRLALPRSNGPPPHHSNARPPTFPPPYNGTLGW